uniref:Ig-like domain-containing protein n=1 Tax=Seriola lalandi dorsalis TaxID=1841481 RepID=A0A3B4X607_SERLL
MTLVSVLIWTLLCFTQGSVGQNLALTQSAAKSVQLGQTVSIDCKASLKLVHYSGSQYYLSWYHQKPGEAPKHLMYLTSDRFSGISSRFSGSGAGNGVDFTLTISGVQAEDSGVYHCHSHQWLNNRYFLEKLKLQTLQKNSKYIIEKYRTCVTESREREQWSQSEYI